jgi:SAM-dependent methyltransferase
MENGAPIDMRRQMDAIYGELALDRIPWNETDPPGLLVELIAHGHVSACDAADLGCGAGSYAVWLASQGFRVIGIDISPRAIELAEGLARRSGRACRFLARDLLAEPRDLENAFDFAYDWELLHHLFPVDRPAYVRNVHRMVRPGGTYFSVCFSERDPAFGGTGKYRKTSIGTTLYFSSEDELRELFEPLFAVQDMRTLEIAGTRGPHVAIASRMRRP